MLIWSGSTQTLDPNVFSIVVFKNIQDKDMSEDKILSYYKMMWLYHMFNPKSIFKAHKTADRSKEIIKTVFPVEHSDWIYVAKEDEDFDRAIEFYRDDVLKKNPLWARYYAYRDALYNMAKKASNEDSSASEIKIATAQMEELPKLLLKAEKEAEESKKEKDYQSVPLDKFYQ